MKINMINTSLESVLEETNVREAIEYFGSKNNTCGIDGVKIGDIEEYWEVNGTTIIESILAHKYIPGIVKEVEIIQSNGKRRRISQLNSIDRLLLRCITQATQSESEQLLHNSSYAYRINKGVHVAVKQAVKYMSDGREWVAEIDIKSFFDNISHERMTRIIDDTFADQDLAYLIKCYLKMRVESDFEINQINKGILQGSPISPLLSNLYLHELDADLGSKGYSFIRYCDNINIYTKSYEDALDKLNYVKKQLESYYELNINTAKTGVFYAVGRVFLGQVIERSEKNGRLYAHRKKKKAHHIFGNWYKTSIQKVDRNYHLINDGILTKKDCSVLFENEEGKRYLPVETVNSISIYSNVTLTGDFLKFIGEKRICINIFSRKGSYIGEFISQPMRGSAKTLIKQVECYVDDVRRLSIAKTIIMAATHNMRAVIRYYKKQCAEQIFSDIEKTLTACISDMNKASSVEALMLIEARTRQKYYQSFDTIIKNTDFSFTKRTKRPPKDEMNAMISFGNVILYNRIATEIYKTRLDIRVSYLHSANKRSESLNLDIAEIFKPIIVDRAIFTAVNKGILNPEQHFEYVDDIDGVYLNREGRDIFLSIIEGKLYQKIEVDGQKITYDTLIRKEIHKIQDYIEKDTKYKAYKYY